MALSWLKLEVGRAYGDSGMQLHLIIKVYFYNTIHTIMVNLHYRELRVIFIGNHGNLKLMDTRLTGSIGLVSKPTMTAREVLMEHRQLITPTIVQHEEHFLSVAIHCLIFHKDIHVHVYVYIDSNHTISLICTPS